MKKKGQSRVKEGNVYAIPLPDGRFGFGRLFRDGAIAIYKHIGDTMEDTPKSEEYQFIVGVYKDVLTCGDWPLIENRPFANEEEAEPPPTRIFDVMTGKYSKYYRGTIIPSTKAECKDLEVTSVWEAHHIIDRIMGDETWRDDCVENDVIRKYGQKYFDELTKDS